MIYGLLISTAWAQQAQNPQQPGMLEALFPFVIIFVVFYFLLMRPQQKKLKEHQELLKNLKRGDQVVTSGGIYGEITGLTETFVTLEISENVKIKVARSQIAGHVKEGAS